MANRFGSDRKYAIQRSDGEYYWILRTVWVSTFGTILFEELNRNSGPTQIFFKEFLSLLNPISRDERFTKRTLDSVSLSIMFPLLARLELYYTVMAKVCAESTVDTDYRFVS